MNPTEVKYLQLFITHLERQDESGCIEIIKAMRLAKKDKLCTKLWSLLFYSLIDNFD